MGVSKRLSDHLTIHAVLLAYLAWYCLSITNMLDLVIVGGSAAGTAAAVYCARRKLNFKVVAKDLGGEVATSGEIENYPGISHTTGIELSKQFNEQLKYQNVDVETGVIVEKIEQIEGGFRVTGKLGSEEKIYEAKSIIVATGSEPRHLGVEGEEEFAHKGITYCTVCDGPLFKGKTTVTIGTGNSALESALMMGEIAQKHYVLAKYPEFKGEQVLIDKVTAHKNIEVIYQGMTTKVTGDGLVSAVHYTDKDGKEHKLDVQGVMVHIGLLPQSEFIDCVEKTKRGNIIVDRLGKTNCPGIFAAGDVTDIPYLQIGVATGMGIAAALSVITYLNTLAE